MATALDPTDYVTASIGDAARLRNGVAFASRRLMEATGWQIKLAMEIIAKTKEYPRAAAR
ncbi:hypothetical protein [Bradyrhizobium australiense]|uniref:Uncharacterized protein n=1 Tax=Bradyrhizobium australiense TaxID=2721161 RepID=A0A7Y4LXC5_9BRAD|nr:hypothetical protein [Bradyrhizobium australiense]NOJ41580.1 hypothetical protein [Bradyrhizobium australiense]